MGNKQLRKCIANRPKHLYYKYTECQKIKHFENSTLKRLILLPWNLNYSETREVELVATDSARPVPLIVLTVRTGGISTETDIASTDDTLMLSVQAVR